MRSFRAILYPPHLGPPGLGAKANYVVTSFSSLGLTPGPQQPCTLFPIHNILLVEVKVWAALSLSCWSLACLLQGGGGGLREQEKGGKISSFLMHQGGSARVETYGFVPRDPLLCTCRVKWGKIIPFHRLNRLGFPKSYWLPHRLYLTHIFPGWKYLPLLAMVRVFVCCVYVCTCADLRVCTQAAGAILGFSGVEPFYKFEAHL